MLNDYGILIIVTTHPQTMCATQFNIKFPTRGKKMVQSPNGDSLRLLQHSLHPKISKGLTGLHSQ